MRVGNCRRGRGGLQRGGQVAAGVGAGVGAGDIRHGAAALNGLQIRAPGLAGLLVVHPGRLVVVHYNR